MRLWKVRVLCEGTTPDRFVKGHPLRLVRRYVTVLLEAEDSSAAMESGKKYADANAAGDVRWGSFTTLSAASVSLPLELEAAK